MTRQPPRAGDPGLDPVVADIVEILEAARQLAGRSINALMTAAYWSVGRRIVEEERRVPGGSVRARVGPVIRRIAPAVAAQLGAGVDGPQLARMRAFHQAYVDILKPVEAGWTASMRASIMASYLERLRLLAGSRMTAGDVLVIDARRHRTQAQNREDARERLVELLRQALVRPKRRRRTKPTRTSVEMRIKSKKRRSETKRGRTGFDPDA